MSIIKWKPFAEIDDYFNGHSMMSPIFGMDTPLLCDVYRKDGQVIVTSHTPGVHKDDLSVTVEDKRVTISGESKEGQEIDQDNYYSKEISRGSFSRTVSLPVAVEGDKAQAEYDQGVLTISIPEQAGEEQQARKVDIVEKKQ